MSTINSNEVSFSSLSKETKQLTRKHEKLLISEVKNKSSILFNSICLQNNICPKYTKIYYK